MATVTQCDLERALSSGGATIPIHNRQTLPTIGYMVGGITESLVLPSDTDLSTIAYMVELFLSDNETLANDRNIYLGTWDDGKGNLHIDLSENVRDLRDASALMVIRGEIAIWDIANATEIYNPRFTE